MTRAPHLARVAWAVGLVVAMAVGCSTSHHVDAGGVESAIHTRMAKRLAPVKIAEVSCPAHTTFRVGAHLRCTVRAGDAPIAVQVKVTDPSGRITFRTPSAIVVAPRVEHDLAHRLHELYDEPGDRVEVRVHCDGPEVREVQPGATFDCAVEVDGSSFTERATVVDRAGNVAYRLVH